MRACGCGCGCVVGVGVRGCPSLFAGDTPPVYTAPANAILVVGPCLWALLGDVNMSLHWVYCMFWWSICGYVFTCVCVSVVFPCCV